MCSENQEQSLLAQASRGHKEAFGDLYEKYLEDVFRYVFFRVGHQQDAEDLTEVIFIKAWKSIGRCYEEKAPFNRWVFRIAHNTVIDHYRTRKQPEALDEGDVLIDEKTNIESDFFAKEQREALIASLKKLNPVHQHVLTLRFINGLSAKETAKILERTPGAVRVLQHRALQALQQLLLEEGNVV